jgi:hypothetical protein
MNTPSAWMMTLFSAFVFPGPFSGWVSSITRYWVILAERRSKVMKSAFDDAEPYVLTSLGEQFVHYTMNEVVKRLSAS